MAIEGPLRELGIHDVFQLLDLIRKTGRLRVTSSLRENEGTVYFKDGRVVSATIRSNPHPIGGVLLRAGKITEGDLARARAMQQEPGEARKLGEILVASGVITHRELERQVRRQIEAVVFELMSWQEGFFSFGDVDPDDASVDATTSVTTEALLMEGARRVDEWAHIRQRVPHLGAVPHLADVADQHPAALDFLPEEWEVLASVDGESDLRAIAERLGRSDLEVARIVFGLLATGVIVLGAMAPDRDGALAVPHLSTFLAEARDALRGGRADDAHAAAASAVRLAPGDADAHALLGRALLDLDRVGDAEAELRQAIEIDSRNATGLMASARMVARRGELERAIGLWKRVALAHPGSPEAGQAMVAISHASHLTAVLEANDA